MNLVFVDVETQNLFEDIGSRDASRLRVACAVTYASERNDYSIYWERDVQSLIAELKSATIVIGFNVKGFDYEVLKAYVPHERWPILPTLDLMEGITHLLGFRVGLEAIGKATLGDKKSADGVQSVQWFRTGQLEKVAEYCKKDVEITRRIFEFGRKNGFVYYFTRLGSRQKVQVNWRV